METSQYYQVNEMKKIHQLGDKKNLKTLDQIRIKLTKYFID